MIRHVVMVNPRAEASSTACSGTSEDEIVRLTGAQIALVPKIGLPLTSYRAGSLGVRFARSPSLVPCASFPTVGRAVGRAHGPEDFDLDLSAAGDGFGTKILYLYDTPSTSPGAPQAGLAHAVGRRGHLVQRRRSDPRTRDVILRYCVPQGVLSALPAGRWRAADRVLGLRAP